MGWLGCRKQGKPDRNRDHMQPWILWTHVKEANSQASLTIWKRISKGNKSVDERLEMETMGSSTSSKPESKDPFLSLPSDVLVKIIGYFPIAQWPALELLDTNFQSATWIAWRQLRSVNLDREFVIKHENSNDRSSIGNSIVSILQKLVEHSPFLTSLSGIDIHRNAEINLDAMQLLTQFEHLQSISLGDAKFRRRVPLEIVVEFLQSTRCRSSLKELHLFNIVQRQGDRATILDQFASSFGTGREIQSPLKLEKFTFASAECSLFIRLDTLDASRLTELRVGKAWIEPEQLTNVIERAPELQRIEFSFLHCGRPCNGPRLEANKELLTALASCENLRAIKFDDLFGCSVDKQCTNFKSELFEMLKTIGLRGQLRKLGMAYFCDNTSACSKDEICATIRDYIPYLRSIKLHTHILSEQCGLYIVSLPELQEIHITSNSHIGITKGDIVEKVAQLQCLKRLAINSCSRDDSGSLEYLSMSPKLMDLRIRYGQWISADIFVKWSDGLASRLQRLMLSEVASKDENDEHGLVRLLEKAIGLRVLILRGHITDRSLMAIADSCPNLEICGLRSTSNGISVQCLQGIVNRCSKLKRLGGFGDEIRSQLQFPKYRKIADVDLQFWNYDFDDSEYE